jgi:hypothetical protein
MPTRSNGRKTRVAKKNDAPGAKRAKASASKKKRIAKDFAFEPKTELGKALWAIRQRAVASGMKLLNSKELEREIRSRRTGDFENNY